MYDLCHWHRIDTHSGDHGEGTLRQRPRRHGCSARSVYGELVCCGVDAEVVGEVEGVEAVAAEVVLAAASYFGQK